MHVAGKSKLRRKSQQRELLVRSQVVSLFSHGHVLTTQSKARMLVSAAERLLQSARKDDLNSRRRLAAVLFNNKALLRQVYTDIVPRIEKPTGFVSKRFVSFRASDDSKMYEVKLLLKDKPAVAPAAKTKPAAGKAKAKTKAVAKPKAAAKGKKS